MNPEISITPEKSTRQATEPDPHNDPVSWVAWHRAQTRATLPDAHAALEKRRAELAGKPVPPPLVFKSHPVIAVSRQHKQVAIFDSLDVVVPYKPYNTEEAAIREATELLARNGWTKKVEVVYPAVTKMSSSTRPARRKK